MFAAHQNATFLSQGVRGIPSDHLTRVLISVESAREERNREVPDIQHIREQLEQQVSFRAAERASFSRHFSSPHLSSEGMITSQVFFALFPIAGLRFV